MVITDLIPGVAVGPRAFSMSSTILRRVKEPSIGRMIRSLPLPGRQFVLTKLGVPLTSYEETAMLSSKLAE